MKFFRTFNNKDSKSYLKYKKILRHILRFIKELKSKVKLKKYTNPLVKIW